MRLLEFTSTHNNSKLREAAPAIAAPAGYAAMYALARALGFETARQLTRHILQNPRTYSAAMRTAANTFNAVDQMLGGEDLSTITPEMAAELETAATQAIAAQPEEVRTQVIDFTQSAANRMTLDTVGSAADISSIEDYLASIQAAPTDTATTDLSIPEPAPYAAAEIDRAPSIATPAVPSSAPAVTRQVDPVVRTTVPAAVSATGQADVAPRVDTRSPARIGDNDIDLGVADTDPRVGDADLPADAGTAGAVGGQVSGTRGISRPDRAAGTGVGTLGGTDIGTVNIPSAADVLGTSTATQTGATTQAATATRNTGQPQGRTRKKDAAGARDDSKFAPAKFTPIQIADPLRLRRYQEFK